MTNRIYFSAPIQYKCILHCEHYVKANQSEQTSFAYLQNIQEQTSPV